MNIIERLMKDHERFRASLKRLDVEVLDSLDKYSEGWTRKAGARTLSILRDLVAAIEAHEQVERTVLYPEMLRLVPGTAEALRQLAGQHAKLDRLLEGFVRELPQAEKHPTAWMLSNVCDLSNLMEKHMWKEEDELFGLAESRLGPAELDRLDRQAEKLLAAESGKAAKGAR